MLRRFLRGGVVHILSGIGRSSGKVAAKEWHDRILFRWNMHFLVMTTNFWPGLMG